jgi:hypothetical protein
MSPGFMLAYVLKLCVRQPLTPQRDDQSYGNENLIQPDWVAWFIFRL